MARLIIAGRSDQSRGQIARLLSSSGYPVYRICGNAGELRRALNDCDDGVLILAGQPIDCSADELFWDCGDRVQILLIAKPPALEACEAGGIFRLALPSSAQAVVGAVEMLTQLHQMRLPKRVGADRAIVEQAKTLLMQRDGCTEAEAHRAMQRYAMNHGIRMADYAAQIVSASRETEE